MKLERLREILSGYSVPLLESRASAFELLSDIDAEIAKASGKHPQGDNESQWASLRGDYPRELQTMVNDTNKRLAALEASEVELRGYAQCTPTMSVFNDLKERVEGMSEDLTSLENQVARELRALSERVPRLGEDDTYKAWRSEPWPDDVVTRGPGIQLEEAFRAGFRAGRK